MSRNKTGGESWSSSNASLCRGWSESMRACHTSLSMIYSLCSIGGTIPESTGRKSIGVGHRHPMIICMLSCKAMSNFFVCVLLHHMGAAYSATL